MKGKKTALNSTPSQKMLTLVPLTDFHWHHLGMFVTPFPSVTTSYTLKSEIVMPVELKVPMK